MTKQLYTVLLTNGEHSIVVLLKRETSSIAHNDAAECCKSQPDYRVYSTSLIDESRLNNGEIVHVF